MILKKHVLIEVWSLKVPFRGFRGHDKVNQAGKHLFESLLSTSDMNKHK